MPPHHSRRDRSVVPTEKGKEPAVRTWPTPSNPHIVSPGKSTRRPSLSQSLFAQPQASSNPPLIEGNLHSEKHSSNTWTSSSENPELGSDGNGKDNQEKFVLEYNRLAQQHGLRPLVPEDFSPTTGRASDSLEGRRGSWFSKMLRQASEQPEQAAIEPDKTYLQHQRGHSNAPLSLVHNHKRDGLKDQDLKALVRLCGKSPLFLPMDYAPFSLSLPTCFRALAQALVQHADTKGIFRVPGSERVINALYEYYCTDGDTDAISSTTRCPTLPTHIRFNTHDIASTFKRLLAGLPGGILGSLSLFDALVAIHSQLQGGAELLRTKESKLRARLIALAIGTVKSQYQRELICAVFGLLCLVGRIAENAPREDESGRPLPTTDLMGYNALSIVFGPLLIGDLIDNYSMKLADPSAGLVLLPISPPRSRKERHRQKHKHRHRPRNKHGKNHAPSTDPSLSVDKIHIANSITEMLIVHWREVVRQIRSTGSVKNRRNASNSLQYPESVARNVSSSVSENSLPRNPPYLDHAAPRRASPSTVSPAATLRTKLSSTTSQQGIALDPWTPRATKASISSSGSIRTQSTKAAPHLLSPTIEESPLHIDELKPASGSEKTSNSFVSDVTQNAYPMSSDAHPGRTHESSSAASVNRPEMMNNESIVGAGITISHTVPALGTRKTETPRSSLSLEPQNRRPNMSRLDTALLDSSEAEDVTPSPGARVDSSLGSPTAQTVSQHEHTQANPNLKARHQITLQNSRAEASPTDSEYVVDIKKMSSRKIQTDRKTDTPVKVPSLGRILLPYSHNDDRGNGYLPKSNTEPNLHRRGKPMPIQSTDPGHELSGTRVKPNPSSETLGTPADQWRNLKASSKASTESLAKSAKERRLKRSSGHTSSRASGDASILADSRPMTPEWKRQLMRERGKPKEKSTTTARREKESILGDTPPLTPLKLAPRVKHTSPEKYPTDTPYRWASQRSPSKPLPGAVKAMAALFDNAAKESPDTSASRPGGRARNSPRESNDCPCRDTVGESPIKSNPPRGALASMNSSVNLDKQPNQRKRTEALAPGPHSPTPKALNIIRTAPRRPMLEDTPTRSLCGTLRPAQMFSSSRKEPQISPNKPAYERDSGQPPRLGTMVPHQEEPEVGHFVRPSSPATSAQSQDASVAPLHLPDSRVTSSGGSSSFLHAQIRSLQRQLERRNEEIVHLRRRLETQEHMDIGTLCEQLRLAKRECMMWRGRAEAAERRVAVFHRFGDRFQALKDGVDEKDGDGVGDDGEALRDREYVSGFGDASSSSCSVRTESRRAFNDRLRSSFRGNAVPGVGDGDGDVFGDYISGTGDGDGDGGAGGEYRVRRDGSQRTVDLWEAAQEMFDFQHGGSIRV
ncbi:hypothetical protein ANO14919_067420 [Xylariales sp. No.14919]|nr:hypothetical protein ANO14919_067420 [Xylariales sp. No.14919]